MQLSFVGFSFVAVVSAKINMDHHVLQHVLVPTTTSYSFLHLHSTAHITVTVQPTAKAQDALSTTSASQTASSSTDALQACYPTVADGKPDWSAPCRTRQKLIFECQFSGKSTLSEDVWNSILNMANEPPSVANSTQQNCLCDSTDFWGATQQCHVCLNSIGTPQPTDAAAISIISSGFCAPTQTAEVDDYMATAQFTQPIGRPTQTSTSAYARAFAQIGTGAAQNSNGTRLSAQYSPTTNNVPSSLQYSQDMPGWNPSSTTRSGTGAATSIIHAPASTATYVVGTPTLSAAAGGGGGASSTGSGSGKTSGASAIIDGRCWKAVLAVSLIFSFYMI